MVYVSEQNRGKNLPSWNAHFRGGRKQTTNQKTLQCQVEVNAVKINTATERRGGFPGGTSDREPACQCGGCKRRGFAPWVGKIPWRRARLHTLVVLPIKSHGRRSLTGHSPWGHQELVTTEQLSTHKRGGREVASPLPTIRKGFSEKVGFEKRLEGGKAISHVAI